MTGPSVHFATTDADRAAAAALRRAVFVGEMGADPAAESDRFDATADHLILRGDARRDGPVLGTLRIARGVAYTAREFDLSRLRADPRPLAEIGRLCLHPDARGGVAGLAMLTAAIGHLRAEGVGLVVGTGSFAGADPDAHLAALRALRDAALAPEAIRPVAQGPEAMAVEGPGDPSDMARVPPLIKTYLRAGARVGQGAWIDRAFDTIDVCLVLDLAQARLPTARVVPRR